MIVRGNRAHLLGVLSQLPRKLQRPPVPEFIKLLSSPGGSYIFSKGYGMVAHIDINDEELARAVIAGLVARNLT